MRLSNERWNWKGGPRRNQTENERLGGRKVDGGEGRWIWEKRGGLGEKGGGLEEKGGAV